MDRAAAWWEPQEFVHLGGIRTMKKILYRSFFRGWVEITKEQEEKLMEHLRSGITAIPSKEKEKYIQSRFKEEDNNVKNKN